MKIYTTLFFFIFPYILYSNGGPVDMSHFRKTGNIRLMNKQDVILKKEDLEIKIIGDYTEIDVKYELHNLGKKQKIQYGFPIDAYETKWTYGDAAEVFSKHNDCIKYFYAYENSEQLRVSQWIVDSIYNVPTIDLSEESYHKKNEEYQIVRKWSAITLEFDKDEIKKLRIKYKIKNTLRDKVPGFCFIHRYTTRNFTYDLNPSSNWGNGNVEEFTLKIDLRNLGSSKSIYNLNIDNIIEAEKHLYTKSIKNFNLKEANRININYDNRHLKMTKFVKENEVSKQRIKSIDSSSNKENIANLIDNSYLTKWSGKKGDWIEIQFHKTQDIDNLIKGILVLNGDYSSKENFNKSGQIKEAKVILNNKIEFNTEPWEGKKGNRIIKLNKNKHKNVNKNNIIGLSTILAEEMGYKKK
mgnify:CR=1 FL=1